MYSLGNSIRLGMPYCYQFEQLRQYLRNIQLNIYPLLLRFDSRIRLGILYIELMPQDQFDRHCIFRLDIKLLQHFQLGNTLKSDR